MKRIFYIVIITSLISLNISWSVFAKDKPEDEFYSKLTENEQVYQEYQKATINIREKINGSKLQELDKDLGKNSFGSFANYPDVDVYFFASIYEDNLILVKKYAIYDLNGKFLNGGVSRIAKKEAVFSGEFKGWKHSVGKDGLSNDNPSS